MQALHPNAYAVPSLEIAIELCRLLSEEVEGKGDATALPSIVASIRSRIRLQNHFVIGGQQIYEVAFLFCLRVNCRSPY